MIRENLFDVEKKILEACKKAGRARDEVTLVAVTKTQGESTILEAYKAGIREFGENRVQELTRKIDLLPDDILWHMIGHLQTNKVKYIVGKTTLIHSVDSMRLAEEIEKECKKRNFSVDVLIEVNVAEEESKFGLKVCEVAPFIEKLSNFRHIKIKGLMTMPPFVDDSELNRDFFVTLRQLAIDIERQKIDNVSMGVLSMGMTNDYQVAIEEGATIIRVGTGIFGARNGVRALN